MIHLFSLSLFAKDLANALSIYQFINPLMSNWARMVEQRVYNQTRIEKEENLCAIDRVCGIEVPIPLPSLLNYPIRPKSSFIFIKTTVY